MAAELTQDSVLHYLRSGGGSVKNSELLVHFRTFIRDHPDRDRNRDLFKKFVNTVATVQQLDGVSYVVLRRKFRGRVPGGGEGGSAGRSREPSPGYGRGSPARLRAPHREATTPAPPGEAAVKTVLPAAGIMLNNNNNVEANLNLKQQPVVNKPAHLEMPAAAAANNPRLSHPPALDHHVGQNRVSSAPPLPGFPPVVAPVNYRGETRQQIPVQEPLRGTELDIRAPILSNAFAPHQSSKLGQNRVGFNPPLQEITPVVVPTLYHGETRQQIPIQEPVRSRQPDRSSRGFSGAPDLDQGMSGHSRQGFNPPPSGITPVVAPVRYQEETRQQVSIQEPLRGRDAELRTQSLSEPFGPLPTGIPPAVVPGKYHGETRQQIPVQEPRRGRDSETFAPEQSSKLGQNRVGFSELPSPDQGTKSGQNRVGFGPVPTGITPAVSPVINQGERRQQILVQEPLRGKEAQLRTQSLSELPDPDPGFRSQVAPRRARHRKSYKSAVSIDEDEDDEEEGDVEEVPVRRSLAGGELPLSVPLGNMGKEISASSPCIIDVPSSSLSEKTLPKIYVQDVEEETLPPRGDVGARGQWVQGESNRHSLPLETQRYMHPPQGAPKDDVHADRRNLQPADNQRARLSSSTGNILSMSDTNISSKGSPMSDSPRGSGWKVSYEDLRTRTGSTGSASDIQEVLLRAQRSRIESHCPESKIQAPWHHSMGDLSDEQHIRTHMKPWHLSTGDLYDDHEEAELREDSTSSPPLRQHHGIPRRLSSKLRSRMCRSMGADLDQLLQEEGRGGGSEAARLNRLQLISSTLSLRYDVSSSSLSSCSTPPRCQSLASLTGGVEVKGARRSLPGSSSTGQPEGSGKQSLVPLESREHEWLVKSAAGAWPDIYALFREDLTLLNRRDFISGFTVLHWIAKHGDHRVLNTLWYGVQKVGLSFDINARSTCGHTPLHIAAIHGHKNIMRLLVSKFSADVKLRDTAGKKPWQYLTGSSSPEIFQLLGAPARAALGGTDVGVGRGEVHWKQERHVQRRRRKHHLSSASGERPMGISAKVKRSSSIAAFLKHKSFRHFHGHQADSSI